MTSLMPYVSPTSYYGIVTRVVEVDLDSDIGVELMASEWLLIMVV